MNRELAHRVQFAVAEICPEIQARVSLEPTQTTEAELWRELSCCLLSSQVPYSLALAASSTISASQILSNRSDHDVPKLRDELYSVLVGTFVVDGSLRKYRFPSAKAGQLANSWGAIVGRFGTLASALQSFESGLDARNWLVKWAPGLGPKQASMFLRNVGMAYDLAVIDRHVLRYMEIVGLGERANISQLAKYRAQELVLQEHAASFGYSVGLVDWAIWIVMRVLKGEPKEENA